MLSRKCVPFTPYQRDIKRAIVALVTAGGVHRKDQPAFNIADELGDLTFRIIDGDARAEDLMVTHHHYDHSDADKDINVVYPIDPLRDRVAEGLIAAAARGDSAPDCGGNRQAVASRHSRSHRRLTQRLSPHDRSGAT